MLRSDARLVTFFSALGFALVTACSGAPGPGGDTPERGEDDATEAKAGKTSSTDKASGTNTGSNQTGTNPPATTTPPTDPAPASPTRPGTDCSGQKSLESCMQCCVATNAAAWEQSVQVFGQCAQQECKSVCQSNPSSLQCAQCPLSCMDKADLWCQQNAQCAPVLQCVTSSKCEEKL